MIKCSCIMRLSWKLNETHVKSITQGRREQNHLRMMLSVMVMMIRDPTHYRKWIVSVSVTNPPPFFFFFKKIISYWPMVAPYIAEPLIFLPISGTKTNNKTNRPPKSRDSSLERALRKRRERSWGGHICTTRVGKNNNNNKPPSLTLCYF